MVCAVSRELGAEKLLIPPAALLLTMSRSQELMPLRVSFIHYKSIKGEIKLTLVF